MQTLVIDTSYGSTVGVVGHEPIVETDSRTHVEKLQVNIAQAVEQAGLQASDITRIVVGVGPAPFTGLRAGIVAAKALAFATGAQLVGQDVLAPQCLAHTQATDDRRHLTLAVNDARRRQLYFALYDGGTVADGVGQSPITLIDMDIDYPDSITMRVNDVLTKLADTGKPYVVDVIGHGAVKYAQSWNAIASSAKSTTMLCSTKARKDWRDSRPSPPANRRWQNRPPSNRYICVVRTCQCPTRSSMCSTMPAPNERSDGTPMIVDHSQIPEDTAVGQIAALEKDLFGRGAWSEQSVRQEFHAPARTYLLDIEGDAVQTADPVVRGYAGYWYDGDDAEIMTIGVGRPYQRQGIAAALLETLIVSARRQGAKRMLLEVRVDNVPALALYERFGFTRMGLRKRYYQPEGIDAYTMSLDLEPRVVGFSATADTEHTSATHTTEQQ